jgi:hypothetical protein
LTTVYIHGNIHLGLIRLAADIIPSEINARISILNTLRIPTFEPRYVTMFSNAASPNLPQELLAVKVRSSEAS